ncbi:DNA-processing protein DprA [Clostridium isatidis]|uniref:DNA protecting protein DprA n=1 Tax=Clostridium isatidis TaxID=182773 RepID=A0A343JBM4_9CLOT|nr:DNA-processing protein DprA [Clostridium isatidis]ASW42932.1 DNA protecting protein DprA [Clostridium isatidis]NLZ34835.1 DNA-protecting protein DprA [Clostridiales bacterium]
MNKDELWFILLNLSNKEKISLIKKYKSINYIRNNINKISELYKLNLELKESQIEELIEYMEEKGIDYITIFSEEYPETLLSAYDPPYALFYIGNLDLLKSRMIAVIGARNCSQYGMEAAKLIAKELSDNNVTIVSGMAIGIDSIAQKCAVENSGKTIAVLGCGVDYIYPKSNKLLYENIKKDGLIISEYIPRTNPRPYYFPMRNRIISGISEGLIVVEASSKSGSLITADYALYQGKSVMAVPGSIFQRNSNGCNKLIRDGAHILSSLEDLRSLFNLKKKDKEKGKISSLKMSLFNIISDEPKHLDEILESVNVDRKVLFGLLFEMQKKNEIICLPGNYYVKSL